MPDLKENFVINTITQLSCFLVFSIAMNQLSLLHVLVMTSLLVVALIAIKAGQFLRMLKRMKWFFLVMLLIFTFNTPGQHIQGWDYFLSPTYEGLASGLLQVFRMLALLAALSLIMAINTKQQLISGFCFMLLPLQFLGFEIQRFAARLWLTLEYVEAAQYSDQQKFKQHQGLLNQLKAFGHVHDTQPADSSITFTMPVFKVLDMVVIAGLMVISCYVLVKALA
ncbi:MAG: hypothetical protein V4575_06180 [Pseudomonadota bacterium]